MNKYTLYGIKLQEKCFTAMSPSKYIQPKAKKQLCHFGKEAQAA
jgi:hypothetical protein